jgi:hypothetical protein
VRRAALVATAALAAGAALSGEATADEGPEEAPRWAVSDDGHRYRVAFDPASRVAIGVAGAAERGGAGEVAPAPEIDLGLSYRTVSATGSGRERVTWNVEHRVVEGWVQPLAHPAPRVPALDAGLYRISTLRHDASPSLVLPTSPPVGIPFPFDVGFDAEAGRVFVPAYTGALRAGGPAPPVVHVGVVHAAFLLDPWRSGATGQSVELGVGARYDLDVVGAPSLATPAIIHRVAPMTAGSVRFRVESRDGLALADLAGEVVPHWTSERTWAVSAQGGAHLERAFLAIDDQPIAAVLDGGYRYLPATRAAEPTNDFRVSLGLSLHLGLR